VLIDRVEDHVRLPGSVPLPRELDGIDLTVLDTGWTTRELDASTADARHCWVASQPAQDEVMIACSQTRALGQTEAVLACPEPLPMQLMSAAQRLLTSWTVVGVVATEEVDLIVELLTTENDGMAREDAQRLVGERHGVAMRTIRRRRDATAARLRDAAPRYLAAIA
jgi:hypothetical protein